MLDSILLLMQNRECLMGYGVIEKMELKNVRDSLGILYPRGATVGGSSQVNAMNFVLPPDNDWLHIAQLTGDRSWEPKNMRKFFTEFEKNEYLPGARQPGHGYNGYISVRLRNRVLCITAKISNELCRLISIMLHTLRLAPVYRGLRAMPSPSLKVSMSKMSPSWSVCCRVT